MPLIANRDIDASAAPKRDGIVKLERLSRKTNRLSIFICRPPPIAGCGRLLAYANCRTPDNIHESDDAESDAQFR